MCFRAYWMLVAAVVAACAAPAAVPEPSPDKGIDDDLLELTIEQSPGFDSRTGTMSFNFCLADRPPEVQELLVEESEGWGFCEGGADTSCWHDGHLLFREPHGDVGLVAQGKQALWSWMLPAPETGTFHVDVWLPKTNTSAFTDDAQYTVSHHGFEEVLHVPQWEGVGQWRRLGTYDLPVGLPVRIQVRSGDGLPVIADAARLERVVDEPQLLNAAWLAWISSNEYAHFAHLGPVLEEIGFGQPGDGQWWADLGRELYALRDAEEAGQIPAEINIETLQSEAPWKDNPNLRVWYVDNYLSEEKARPVELASAFEKWLVHEARPWNPIQFFSGGPFTVLGNNYKTGSTQALWAEHRDKPMVVIAFRGTEPPGDAFSTVEEWEDVLIDISIFRQDLDTTAWGRSWGYVHEGFHEAYNSVANELLLERLRALEGTDTAIYVTGHSLGGSLATMMTARIMADMEEGARYNLKAMYTFGQPRVGGEKFVNNFNVLASKYGVNVHRFRNTNDIVTRVPFGPGWEHVGTHDYLTREGDLIINPTEWPWDLTNSIVDHEITNGYYPKIFGLLDKYRGLLHYQDVSDDYDHWAAYTDFLAPMMECPSDADVGAAP